MSEAPQHATLAEVLATARTIVNHKSSRGAIGVPVTHIAGMAHALCALHDIAMSAAEMLAASERSGLAADRDDIDTEVAEVEVSIRHQNDLTDGLLALGLLTLAPQEATDGREV
ncbi:Uncharacterised protein [Starkeya nomas]|uniref:Uncharacterized protein n=1 Tax=Starkeya nomas TaxID=2666134 RepID=A0A5S9R6U9_9HYPH|nr:hypothetical protein [Starkeya nomas]CAA0130249.1 Uncharacterised protein [Starkeya nomas]